MEVIFIKLLNRISRSLKNKKSYENYSDVLLKRINHFRKKIEDTIIEPTRGQNLLDLDLTLQV
jgi:hypothetical protein